MSHNVFTTGGLQLARAAAGALAAVLVFAAPAHAAGSDWEEEEQKPWEEIEAQLPPLPQEANLREFYVDPRSTNRYYVDAASISVGQDGVVRYSLVIISASGARNISYEGLRCETSERRFYAFGNSSGTWSKARSTAWKRINDSGVNRQQAVLAEEYFCPLRHPVQTPDEARDALRRGGHPNARSTKGP